MPSDEEYDYLSKKRIRRISVDEFVANPREFIDNVALRGWPYDIVIDSSKEVYLRAEYEVGDE